MRLNNTEKIIMHHIKESDDPTVGGYIHKLAYHEVIPHIAIIPNIFALYLDECSNATNPTSRIRDNCVLRREVVTALYERARGHGSLLKSLNNIEHILVPSIIMLRDSLVHSGVIHLLKDATINLILDGKGSIILHDKDFRHIMESKEIEKSIQIHQLQKDPTRVFNKHTDYDKLDIYIFIQAIYELSDYKFLNLLNSFTSVPSPEFIAAIDVAAVEFVMSNSEYARNNRTTIMKRWNALKIKCELNREMEK